MKAFVSNTASVWSPTDTAESKAESVESVVEVLLKILLVSDLPAPSLLQPQTRSLSSAGPFINEVLSPLLWATLWCSPFKLTSFSASVAGDHCGFLRDRLSTNTSSSSYKPCSFNSAPWWPKSKLQCRECWMGAVLFAHTPSCFTCFILSLCFLRADSSRDLEKNHERKDLPRAL